MSQQLLQGFQIRAVLQHMYGEGIPQHLRCQAVEQLCFFSVLFQDFPEPLPRDGLADIIDKQAPFLRMAGKDFLTGTV